MKVHGLAAGVLCGLFYATAHAQVRVNRPDDFCTRDGSTTQSETNHAVTANGILAAWNDSSQLAMSGTTGISYVAWGYSQDGGRSFTGGDFFTLPDNRTCLFDPAIVADSLGYFYLAAVASQPDPQKNPQDTQQNLAVARSTGNTAPFSFGKAVILEPTGRGGALDKELMAFDRTRNRIYIAATDNTQGVVFAYTKALSPRLELSPWQLISPDLNSLGAMPVVAPNGDLYVIWTRDDRILEMRKSTDGGKHFRPVREIAQLRPVSNLPLPSGAIRTKPFAQIAVDSTATGSPTRGNVYIVIAARPAGSDDLADIYFTRSTDGGRTWAPPRSISSGLAATLGQDLTTNDNWMPSIAVSPVNGHIYVTFYDRRGDPDDFGTRVFRALSTDGGLTWANAPLSASRFIPIVGFPQVGTSSYWGEYNWTTADAAGIHFTWGDSHLYKPRGMCDPTGRPDLDVYYHTIANLRGPDLFIQPWGAVTGLGPEQQSPDVFVVDQRRGVVDPRMGKVNRLRARVRNLGNLGARGAVVRFRYAPVFPGADDLPLKDAGSVRLSFPAAGGRGDTQIAKVLWDLQNVHDTNGGQWPAEIGTFAQLRVKVSVEFAADVNLSNNAAESDLAVATGRPIRAPEPLAKFRGIGPVTARYWEVKAPPRPPDRPSTPGFQRPPPPPQVIPEGVTVRRTYAVGYDAAFDTALTSFQGRQKIPAVANRERGLINSQSERLTAEEIRKLVVAEDAPKVTGDGYAIVSLYFQPRGEGHTEVGAAALIAVDDGESPLGKVLTSNGTLEASYLDAVTASMPPR